MVRNIEMIQSNTWPDMEAPEDSKVLLDLVYAVETSLVRKALISQLAFSY